MKVHNVFRVLAAVILLVTPAAAQQQAPAQPGNTPPGNADAPLPPLPSGQDGTATAPLPPLTPDSNSNDRPVPTARGIFVANDTGTNDTSQPVPDTHVLSDSEVAGVGLLQGRRNIFDPRLHISEAADSGIAPGIFNSVTTFGGSLTLNRFWSRYHLFIGYDGAALLYRPSSVDNASYHNFSISQEIRWNRWRLRLRNDGQFAPQSPFGGLDIGIIGLGQTPNPVPISPSVFPGDTILTGRVDRLQDVVLADVYYDLTRRSTLTFSADYGWFQFLKSGYLDSRTFDGRVGYNYALNARDSIAVIFSYSQTNFNGTPSLFRNDTVRFAYGRKVTGRLAFQVSAGPQYFSLVNIGSAGSNFLSWTGSTSLAYRMRRTNYTVLYSYASSPGSGVLLGAQTHTATATVNHAFSRNWTALASGGYTRSNNLIPSITFANLFSAWTANASLDRRLGPTLHVAINYGFVQPTNSGGACPVLNCGVNSLRQVVGVTVNWHIRPVNFE